MSRILEIRSYNLKPGSGAAYHALFLEQALPLLNRWNIDVVAAGPSLESQDAYYLMRSFESMARRDEQEDAFYGSDEWRQGPRESVLALIENYTTVVLEVDETTLAGLRRK